MNTPNMIEDTQVLAQAYEEFSQINSSISNTYQDFIIQGREPLLRLVSDLDIFMLPVWAESAFPVKDMGSEEKNLVLINFLLVSAFTAVDRLFWESQGGNTGGVVFRTMGYSTYLIGEAWNRLSPFIEQNKMIKSLCDVYLDDTWSALASEGSKNGKNISKIDPKDLFLIGKSFSWLKIGPMTLALLANKEAEGQKFVKNLDVFLNAFVLEANIINWLGDLQLGRKTFVQARLQRVRPSLGEVADGGLDRSAINDLMAMLHLCTDWYQQALTLFSQWDLIPLSKFIVYRIQVVDSLRTAYQARLSWLDEMEF